MRHRLALAAVFATLVAHPALAFDRELQLGLDLSYAHETLVEDGANGFGAGLRVRYGVTDFIAVTGQVAWAGHILSAEDAPGPLDHVLTATAGVAYALDVLRLVPYFGLQVGAGFHVLEQTAASFVLHGHGGFDFLWNRDVSTGLDVAYQLFVGEQVSPARIVVSIRVSWHRLMI